MEGERADIEIGFHRLEHRDPRPFDGPAGNIVAHVLASTDAAASACFITMLMRTGVRQTQAQSKWIWNQWPSIKLGTRMALDIAWTEMQLCSLKFQQEPSRRNQTMKILMEF